MMRIAGYPPVPIRAGSLRRQSLRDLWTSSGMKEVRRKMLSGEKIEACNRCYQESERGVLSNRQNNNLYWLTIDRDREKWKQRVQNSIDQNHEVSQLPIYYDLRPGNLCTLKCRMCHSYYSSLIQKDPVHGKWDPWEPDKEKTRFSDGLNWYEAESVVVEEVLENVQETRMFYLAGGEPLVNPMIKQLLDRLIGYGVSHRIKLSFSTNITIFPKEFIRKLSYFESVELFISIDGFGPVYEYIRYPGKWPRIVQNLEKAINHGKCTCTIVSTIQNYNILSISDLLKFTDSYQLPCNLTLLYYPSFLSIRVMPQKAKQLAIKRLKECEIDRQASPAKKGQGAALTIEHIITELEQDHEHYYHQSIQEFMKFTNDLDKSRTQSFKDACPEFYQFIIDDRGAWTDEFLFYELASC